MSDQLHLHSSAVPSPGRTPAISRPAWPWQPSSSRPQSTSSSVSLEHRPSLLNSSRPTSSPGTSLTWQPNTTSRSAASSGFFMGNIGTSNNQEDDTRQWSFLGFEWIVRDVHKLRDFVEGVNADTRDPDFDILKQSPVLGDNKFKLEIAFTPHPEAPSGSCDKPTLSLYITSLMVDLAHADYELSASMMTAIKTQPNRAGERTAPAEWVWDFWQTEWAFRREHEVWECPLPPLSVLLENSKIQEADCFVICVQIHCPTSLSYPQQPSLYPIPRDLLEGLEASLDNANTGDVRFICLERLMAEETQLSPKPHQPDITTPSRRSSSSTSSHLTFSPVTTARKRVIYAHSDILVRRSEYFATMLASSFSENPSLVTGERKIYTIVVEEADFETIYWLLKFCYTNWLLFREQDDPRLSIDGAGVGWSTRWLHSRGGEWDWKTFHKDDGVASDTRSVASGESLRSVAKSSGVPNKPDLLQPAATAGAAQTSRSPSSTRTISSPIKATSTTPSSNTTTSASRRTTSTPNTSSIANKNNTTKPIPIPLTTTNFASPARPSYPLSPRGSRQHPLAPISTPDPHPHPTVPPKPASALSIYQVAHRYAMPGLAALALEHMMSTITPQSSFPLLLASSVWDELYALVEDYVIEKWDEVSISEEFEQCCQEVAAGEWGSEGGKTLMRTFRRLRSPNTN